MGIYRNLILWRKNGYSYEEAQTVAQTLQSSPVGEYGVKLVAQFGEYAVFDVGKCPVNLPPFKDFIKNCSDRTIYYEDDNDVLKELT